MCDRGKLFKFNFEHFEKNENPRTSYKETEGVVDHHTAEYLAHEIEVEMRRKANRGRDLENTTSSDLNTLQRCHPDRRLNLHSHTGTGEIIPTS